MTSDLQEATGNAEKIFWFEIILIGIGASLYSAVSVWQEFFNNPTFVTVKTVIAEDGVAIPDVAVCPTQPFDPEKVSKQNFSQTELQFFYSIFTNSVLKNATFFGLAEKINFNRSNLLLKDRAKFEKFLLYDSVYDCEEIFLHCELNGIPFNCRDQDE